MHGETYADLPASLLTDGAIYDRPRERPAYLDETGGFQPSSVADTTDPGADLLTLLGSPNIASKAWVYQQYDYNVRHGTVLRPGTADAGVVRVLCGERAKGVAISAGCNSRWVYLDPFEGTRAAVAEAYANLSAVGATPLAVTNCLNFGNPEKPEIMWQFAEAVRGLGDACKLLDTPVVSGNVSLYNETDGTAIRPTPMIGMVGLLPDASRATPLAFPEDGLRVAVVGAVAGGLGASDYLEVCRGQAMGSVRAVDESHKATCDAVRELVRTGALASCHDISEGGLAVAIAECAVAGGVGVKAELPGQGRADELLFGEGPGRFVISYRPEQAAAVANALAEVELTEVGTTGGESVALVAAGLSLSVPLAEAISAYQHGFDRAVD
jgi:phosphoribosylformylglycinamidine synthase